MAALAAVGVLGYWLRFDAPVAGWLRDGSGGAAYVVFWMLAVAVVKPVLSTLRLTLMVFTATCAIEFSQAWHPAWLDAVRRTLPGRLILGTTFDWFDFPPYFAGAILGWVITTIAVSERGHRTKRRPE